MNHTPGPWKYEPDWGTVMSVGPVKQKICDPPCQNLRGADGSLTPAEAEFYDGNNRLIAAAPELLAALSMLLRTCQDAVRHGWTDAETEAIHWAAVDAQAAIAKAEGR